MRMLLLALAVLAGCTNTGCDATSAKPTPSGLQTTTIGERFSEAPFAILIDAPTTVALVGGGELSVSSQTCRACHPEVYKDWARSTHANALTDPQFIAELSKDTSPRWMCLNCHIPLKNQRSYLVDADTVIHASVGDVRKIDKRPNPDFSEVLQREAVTCATCHVRKDKDGKGIIHGPRGSPLAPHRTVKSTLQAQICTRCHDPGPMRLTTTFLCWFESDREMAEPKPTCGSCHMPRANLSIAVGRPPQQMSRHTFIGPIPKTFEGFASRDERGFQSGLDVEVKRIGAVLQVQIKNAHAAHNVPTADPERHIEIRMVAKKAGTTILQKTEKLAQHWDWGDAKAGRSAKRTFDNRLKPGESRQYEIPIGTASEVEIEIEHIRVTRENLGHMKAAKIDKRVERLAPNIKERLRNIERNYPRSTFVYAARYDIPTGTLVVEPAGALLRRSVAQ